MIDLSPLARRLAGTPLADWANTLQVQLDKKMEKGHGDLERWQSALDALPKLLPTEVDLLNGLTLDTECDDDTRAQMRTALMGLSPWRKGPFDLFGVHVDTEWRSDWKWSRVAPHLELKGKRILDVGCGNGYYMWRMLGAGAEAVVGVDPNWLFLNQFLAVKNYLPDAAAWHLPLALEELPLHAQPYLEVRVLLDGPEPGLRAQIDAAIAGKPVRLDKIDPHSRAQIGTAADDALTLDQLAQLQPDEVFRRLYQQRFGEEAPADQLDAFAELLLGHGQEAA